MSHTLLLADDSVTIQRVIELTFADEDIRVVAVSDGAAAIGVLDQSPPDIVLADVGMPGVNGYDVARHMKATPGLAHIPVVLLTGAFEPIDRARVAEVGGDDVLAKPFEPQVVIARVKELLARPREAQVQPWTPPAEVEARPAMEEASPIQTPAATEDYFDRLDAALSHLAGTSQHRPPVASAATDKMVDEVTRRVLVQLSDRVVRETVAEIVSASAERLIREEIERIKREIG